MESVLTVGGSARSRTTLSSTSISAGVSATSAGPWGAARAIIAVQKQRQAMTEKTAMSLVRRSAVRRRAASARQPDFSTLWNSSIFQRHAYQRSFLTASSTEVMGRSVASFQLMRVRPCGLAGVQDRELEGGVALLLANRRQDMD